MADRPEALRAGPTCRADTGRRPLGDACRAQREAQHPQPAERRACDRHQPAPSDRPAQRCSRASSSHKQRSRGIALPTHHRPLRAAQGSQQGRPWLSPPMHLCTTPQAQPRPAPTPSPSATRTRATPGPIARGHGGLRLARASPPPSDHATQKRPKDSRRAHIWTTAAQIISAVYPSNAITDGGTYSKKRRVH